MSDPRTTEAMMREYLELKAEERAKGITLESLYRSQQRILNDRNRDRFALASVIRNLKRYGRRLARLEEHASAATNGEWRADPEEITGTHEYSAIMAKAAKSAKLEEIEERLDEEEERKREEETWWRRQRWLWAGIVVAGLLAGCTTGCVGYALYRVQTLEKHISEQRRSP